MGILFRTGHGKAARSKKFANLSAGEASVLVDKLKSDKSKSQRGESIVVQMKSGKVAFTSRRPATLKSG